MKKNLVRKQTNKKHCMALHCLSGAFFSPKLNYLFFFSYHSIICEQRKSSPGCVRWWKTWCHPESFLIEKCGVLSFWHQLYRISDKTSAVQPLANATRNPLLLLLNDKNVIQKPCNSLMSFLRFPLPFHIIWLSRSEMMSLFPVSNYRVPSWKKPTQ